ncbi:MAG: sulfotransferase domain-containing protein [Bacteroidetes bacterium]|nr:sulfotransferase domain-containing protein [Bacteroidota bacterium]
MPVFFIKIKLQLKGFLLRLFFFKVEQDLLRGKLHTQSNRPSFIFFTVHKAASSLLSQRLAPFFRKNNYRVADLSSYFAKTGLQRRESFLADEDLRARVFSVNGIFHVAFRFPFSIPVFSDVKILLVLRDPRDVLVSHYFSTKYSHPALNSDFFALKEKAGSLSIDEYVKYITPDFKKRFRTYLTWIGKPNVLFMKYETLISDPQSFEDSLSVFADLPVEKGEIVSEKDFMQEKEDVHAHKRYVRAGDHKNKLQKETIVWLNGEFSETLAALGYEN